MVLLLVFMQLTRDLFAIAKFLLHTMRRVRLRCNLLGGRGLEMGHVKVKVTELSHVWQLHVRMSMGTPRDRG